MSSQKEPYSLKKIFEKTSFGIASNIIKSVWQQNRYIIYLDLAITGLISDLAAGYFYQLINSMHSGNISFWGILMAGLIKIPWLTLIFMLFINFYTYRFIAAAFKETIVDDERNYNASNEGYNGTARKMTQDEKEKVFTSGDYAAQKGNILGAEPKNNKKLYSLKSAYGMNGNVCIVGAPGCGKSRCYGIPIIMQTIRREESLIVTDPKGELYRDTAAMAKANGYVVKLLDFRPEHSMHTDTCNYMSIIGADTYKAQSFSKTVIDNTSDGKAPDFWSSSEFNLFIGICIMVNSNNWGIPKTMGGIYEFMYSNSLDEFEDMCLSLESDHPSMPYLNTFLNGDKTVKGNTYAGLQIRLSALADPLVRNIVGTDDIDLTLPGQQKCIYYISSPDTDKSRSYLVALFFTLLYNQLINYADEQEDGHLNVRVTMLLDEFANIGVIPAFPEKLSTVRSRWIDTIIMIQDIGQLQKMYPENEWETIINDCSTKILISANNMLTSDYFSELSGDQTTEDKGIRYEESAGDIFRIHPKYNVTQSHGSRMLYTPHEIRTLDPTRVLVFISQHNVVELEKIDYSNHPMCKEMRKWPPKHHAPQWILSMGEEDRKKFRVYNETYRLEKIDDIELCTDDDFKTPWNKKREADLQKHILNYHNKVKKEKIINISSDQLQKKQMEKTARNVSTILKKSQDNELNLKDTLSEFAEKHIQKQATNCSIPPAALPPVDDTSNNQSVGETSDSLKLPDKEPEDIYIWNDTQTYTKYEPDAIDTLTTVSPDTGTDEFESTDETFDSTFGFEEQFADLPGIDMPEIPEIINLPDFNQ